MKIKSDFVVAELEDGLRLDSWLVRLFKTDYSRSQIQKWISGGYIQESSVVQLKPGLKIKAGQTFKLLVPDVAPLEIKPVDLGLKIIYEDKYLAVIHKPAGISTHPGPADQRTSLVNGIVYQWRHLIEKKNLRPGVVHRLDKDTEGLMLIGLDSKIKRDLMKLFELRQVKKEYQAWVIGSLPGSTGIIELGIRRNTKNRLKMEINPEGRLSVTEFERLKQITSKKGVKYDLVNLNIKTGRTHQIRVQMAHLKTPIVGDALYSSSANQYKKYGMLLYSRLLAFEHPVTLKKLEFCIDAPKRFELFEKDMNL